MPDDPDEPYEDDMHESDPDQSGEGDNHEPSTAPDDEPIGYKHPPRNGQFPKGKSGNPGGRPKGSRGLGADLKAELSERVPVILDGRQRRIPKRRLIIKALAAKAAKGDVRAADKLLQLVIQSEGFEDQRTTKRVLSTQEQALLDRLFAPENDTVQQTEDVGEDGAVSATPADLDEGDQ